MYANMVGFMIYKGGEKNVLKNKKKQKVNIEWDNNNSNRSSSM